MSLAIVGGSCARADGADAGAAAARVAAAGADGNPSHSIIAQTMATAESIEQSIAAGLDCEHLQVVGDGHHWEALVVSARLRGAVEGPPAPARLQGAGRPDARGDPRAVDDHAHARAVGRDAQGRLIGQAADRRRPPARRRGPRLRRQERGAADPVRGAAVAGAAACSPTSPRLNDVRTMQTLLAQMGVRLDAGTPGAARARRRRRSTGRSRPTSS